MGFFVKLLSFHVVFSLTKLHLVIGKLNCFQMVFQERQHEEGEPIARKAYDEPVVFNWTVDIDEDVEVEKKKKIIKSPHFWVSGYEM